MSRTADPSPFRDASAPSIDPDPHIQARQMVRRERAREIMFRVERLQELAQTWRQGLVSGAHAGPGGSAAFGGRVAGIEHCPQGGLFYEGPAPPPRSGVGVAGRLIV